MTAPGVSSVPGPTEMMKNKFQREYISRQNTQEPEISPKKKGKEDENDEKKRKGTKKKKKKKSKRTITSHTAHTFTVCLHVDRVRTSKSHRPKMCLEPWNIGNHRPSLSPRSRTPRAFSFERFSYFFFSFAMSLCTIYPKYTHTHTHIKSR
jgi:hypothetical protein